MPEDLSMGHLPPYHLSMPREPDPPMTVTPEAVRTLVRRVRSDLLYPGALEGMLEFELQEWFRHLVDTLERLVE